MDPQRTLTIMQAAAAAGVSRRTIYNWISAGKLQYIRTAGGAIRIDPASLWRDAQHGPIGTAGTTSGPPDRGC